MEFRIGPADAGVRVDIQASALSGLTRSHVRRLIEASLLRVNGSPARPGYRTRPGDVISIVTPDETGAGVLVPEERDIAILHLDDEIVVVDKPPDMVVYPAAGHPRGTLMNALAARCRHLASVGGPLRPGVVHRLDKDTSGVMVVALTDRAYHHLVLQFRERTTRRCYAVIVAGTLRQDQGEIVSMIGRSSSDRKKMSTRVRSGKKAVTTWEVVERLKDATLIKATLGTGRTHQIRVHFASIGHPVLGDRTYGRKTWVETGKGKVSFPRQMLHAELLGFTHPATGEAVEFRSALPADMEAGLRELRDP